MTPPERSELFDLTADGAIVLRVHVQPGAARTEVAGRHGNAVKVRVREQAQGGRANEAVELALAAALGVPRRAVAIVAGARGRAKRVRIEAITPTEATARLHELAPPD